MCDAEMLNSSEAEDFNGNERESSKIECESERINENLVPENKETTSNQLNDDDYDDDDDFYIHDNDDVIIEFLDKSNPIVGDFVT